LISDVADGFGPHPDEVTIIRLRENATMADMPPDRQHLGYYRHSPNPEAVGHPSQLGRVFGMIWSLTTFTQFMTTFTSFMSFCLQ
jgi:hypothetical protein